MSFGVFSAHTLYNQVEWEQTIMQTPSEPASKQDPTQAAEHVASARQILKELQKKVGQHPELGEAITKLEMALNSLAVQTGGML
jgi:hypothetical protein